MSTRHPVERFAASLSAARTFMSSAAARYREEASSLQVARAALEGLAEEARAVSEL